MNIGALGTLHGDIGAVSFATPNTITRYVNTDSTAGGDGTTNETTGSNRAYATLTAAITGEVRDLVARKENLVIWVNGTGDFGRVVDSDFAGMVSSPTYDIYIGALNSDAYAGTEWSTDKPRSTAANFQRCFQVGIAYDPQSITIEGLQFQATGTANSQTVTWGSLGQDTIRLIGCLFHGSSTRTVTQDLVQIDANSPTVLVSNCVFLNEGSGDTRSLLQSNCGNTTIYQNTFKGDCSEGLIRLSGGGSNHYLKNNILEKTGAGIGVCIDDAGISGYTESDANLTSDTTSPDGAAFQNKTATFVSATNLALDSTDTEARDTGVNLASDGRLTITNDTLRTPRPFGSGFDIGAHEYTEPKVYVRKQIGFI